MVEADGKLIPKTADNVVVVVKVLLELDELNNDTCEDEFAGICPG